MKISDADVYLLRIPLMKPIADSIQVVKQVEMIVLKLTTTNGIEGWGFNWTLGTGGDIVRDTVVRYLVPQLKGSDPSDRKTLQDQIYSSNTLLWDYRLGQLGVSQMGMAAIDMALWDVSCKESGLPLWKMLNGDEHKEKIEAYNTDVGWLSFSIEELIKNCKEAINQGFKAVKIKIGKKDPAEDYSRIGEVRAAVGDKVKIMVDANAAWDVETSIKWGCKLTDYEVFWLEEPTNPLDVKGHAKIASNLNIPIAVGESIYSKLTFKQYIDAKACEIVQVDTTKVTGITEWLEVARLASSLGLRIVPHTNIQYPIHIQLVAVRPMATMLEYVPWCLEVWKEPIKIKNGFFSLPSGPGLNADIKPWAIEEYTS